MKLGKRIKTARYKKITKRTKRTNFRKNTKRRCKQYRHKKTHRKYSRKLKYNKRGQMGGEPELKLERYPGKVDLTHLRSFPLPNGTTSYSYELKLNNTSIVPNGYETYLLPSGDRITKPKVELKHEYSLSLTSGRDNFSLIFWVESVILKNESSNYDVIFKITAKCGDQSILAKGGWTTSEDVLYRKVFLDGKKVLVSKSSTGSRSFPLSSNKNLDFFTILVRRIMAESRTAVEQYKTNENNQRAITEIQTLKEKDIKEAKVCELLKLDTEFDPLCKNRTQEHSAYAKCIRLHNEMLDSGCAKYMEAYPSKKYMLLNMIWNICSGIVKGSESVEYQEETFYQFLKECNDNAVKTMSEIELTKVYRAESDKLDVCKFPIPSEDSEEYSKLMSSLYFKCLDELLSQFVGPTSQYYGNMNHAFRSFYEIMLVNQYNDLFTEQAYVAKLRSLPQQLKRAEIALGINKLNIQPAEDGTYAMALVKQKLLELQTTCGTQQAVNPNTPTTNSGNDLGYAVNYARGH